MDLLAVRLEATFAATDVLALRATASSLGLVAATQVEVEADRIVLVVNCRHAYQVLRHAD